jgi:glycosyltransferase involved in cell wall biosynthesis
MPLASVVIPCYNQAEFLAEAIQSVLAQTYGEIEIVVVDDGSPDDTREVVSRYPGVRYMRQENQGLAGARNTGFQESKGEYMVFLDADDRLTPNAVEAHLSCFAKHPEAGFVVGDIDQIAADGSYIYSPRWPIVEASHYEELLRVNHVANTIAVMFRRSVIDELGGFEALYSPAEDYELLLRATRLFSSVHHRTVVAQYRRHPANLSRKGTVMLGALHRVMERQLPIVNGNPTLKRAWREGTRYWHVRFGPTAIKELFAHLRRCEIRAAASAGIALLWYVRGRLFVFPWVYRRVALNYFRRRFSRWHNHPDHSVTTTVAKR